MSMPQRKHRLHGDGNNTNRKKRKTIQVTTSCFSKENVARIEDLPNEIIYGIFELLEFHDVYRAFYSLNIRFRQLITNSTLPIHVNLSSQSKQSLSRYYEDVILPQKHRVQLLQLSNPCLCDHFISSTDTLSKLLNLKTLSLSNIELTHFKAIIPTLTSLKYLSSLSISTVCGRPNVYLIYSYIFHLETLKYLKISDIDTSYSEPLPVSVNRYSPIEHFVINSSVPAELLTFLLLHLPQLRRLYVQYIYFSSKTSTKPSTLELKYLTHVSFGFEAGSFDQFEQMLIDAFSQIQVLHITLTTGTVDTFINAKKWEHLISSHLPHLRIFDFHYHSWLTINNNDGNQVTTNKLIDQFSSLFWSKQQYYFEEQHQKTKYHLRTVLFSTNPYRRKNYILCDSHPDRTHEIIPKTHLKSVEHIHIASKKVTHSCQYYFPNVTTLTLEDSFSSTLASLVVDLNRSISLTHLNKLILDSQYFSITKLMKLLRFSPNIHTLVFGSLSLYELNVPTLLQNDTFQVISRTNIVADVTVKQVCSLDKLQILMALFPRMQRLNILIHSKDSKLVVKHILEKTKTEIENHLHWVCLMGATKIWMQRIKTLIDSETLLHDYMLKFLGNALYLWW